ncbi:MAG: NADH-quinone oxidoreductase chain 5 [Bacteroidetes bacterium B1(2017)]|nr:MAG: NADH-quinone oxidoreductase chain 5 [Bacteroidetes bacterium B1(2017)]
MENETLLSSLQESFPSASISLGSDWPEMNIEAAELLASIDALKNTAVYGFDFLFCETCVDWKTHFTMVYHLTSTTHRHSMVLKAKVNRDEPVIESLVSRYKTSELLEREVFDLFGVRFLNHPDLRRLLLTEDWVGYPLRKDYDDPINMIKL